MLAYGYKPSDLMQIYALDVLDFKRGLAARLTYEQDVIFLAAEIAHGTKVRKTKNERNTYSPKIREMIEKADLKDKKAGLING